MAEPKERTAVTRRRRRLLRKAFEVMASGGYSLLRRSDRCDTCGGQGWCVYPCIETQAMERVPCPDCTGISEVHGAG